MISKYYYNDKHAQMKYKYTVKYTRELFNIMMCNQVVFPRSSLYLETGIRRT